MIRKGTLVCLTPEARKYHSCPEGRENNKVAKVLSIYGPDNDQVMMEHDLEGCKFWNLSDIKRVNLEIFK